MIPKENTFLLKSNNMKVILKSCRKITKNMMEYDGDTIIPLHSSLEELSQCSKKNDKMNNIRTTLQADSDGR